MKTLTWILIFGTILSCVIFQRLKIDKLENKLNSVNLIKKQSDSLFFSFLEYKKYVKNLEDKIYSDSCTILNLRLFNMELSILYLNEKKCNIFNVDGIQESINILQKFKKSKYDVICVNDSFIYYNLRNGNGK